MVAIETDSLERRFGSVRAVEELDLEVDEGEVFGFLGPNGAGKSTTINMLLGFVPPTAGSATVLGHDAATESLAVRQRTGVLPEDFGVYERLTARKHVRFAIDCKGAGDDPDALLSRVGLADAADRKAGGFSTGMRQRLAFAMALAGEPELLILDEPSSGLDPNGAREMREIVREEVDRGATVFFSSHIMEQVEAICDRVGVMREGRLVACDSIASLKRDLDVDSRLVVEVDRVPEGIREELLALEGVSAVRIDDGEIEVALSRAGRKTAALDAVERSGAAVEDVSTEEPSLEDLFEALTTESEVAP
ncbi:ABC transporter ATP-binding protein [Saliphagus infecundisoli]|uniref:ATP-binding cassette domain-containing protein n=1 Tax=Saliphagus infecundisoli TaxID=1849069 RepID=A0ABD5QKA8_9EURY|nr:ABC transporter ATP-binding protein [Saliphagus infecundisoli]